MSSSDISKKDTFISPTAQIAITRKGETKCLGILFVE
jgi:hypothetical protein